MWQNKFFLFLSRPSVDQVTNMSWYIQHDLETKNCSSMNLKFQPEKNTFSKKKFNQKSKVKPKQWRTCLDNCKQFFFLHYQTELNWHQNELCCLQDFPPWSMNKLPDKFVIITSKLQWDKSLLITKGFSVKFKFNILSF